MVGVLVSANYKYTDVELASGAKVTAIGVTIKNGKVARIDNGYVIVGEDENRKEFSFSAYSDGNPAELSYSTNSVPGTINGQDIAEEFVAFVEADYLSK